MAHNWNYGILATSARTMVTEFEVHTAFDEPRIEKLKCEFQLYKYIDILPFHTGQKRWDPKIRLWLTWYADIRESTQGEQQCYFHGSEGCIPVINANLQSIYSFNVLKNG